MKSKTKKGSHTKRADAGWGGKEKASGAKIDKADAVKHGSGGVKGNSLLLKDNTVAYRDRSPKDIQAKVVPTIKKGILQNDFSYWLGIDDKFVRAIHSDFDLIKLGTAGISKHAFDTLAANIGVSKKDFAENIFDVSIRTLERKDSNDKMDKRISSHAIEIARVVKHGYDVFEDKEKLKRWLNTSNPALNGIKPVDLFDTLTGINLVNDILGRIDEGVYS